MEAFALVRRVDSKDYYSVFTTKYTARDTLEQIRRGLSSYWQKEAKRQPELFKDLSECTVVVLEKFDDWSQRRDYLTKWARQPRECLAKIAESRQPSEPRKIGFTVPTVQFAEVIPPPAPLPQEVPAIAEVDRNIYEEMMATLTPEERTHINNKRRPGGY